ncbi:MAG: hypothetical protein QXU32_01490 [Nitrososphaerales archaeon]
MSTRQKAIEIIEDLLGYEGEGGYKAPSASILPIKQSYDLWMKGKDDKEAQSEWSQKHKLTGSEKIAVRLYYMLGADNNPKAFADSIDLLGKFNLSLSKDKNKALRSRSEIIKILESGIYKHKHSWWPWLYVSIQHALNKLLDHGMYNTARLWPKMVEWIIDEFDKWVWSQNTNRNIKNWKEPQPIPDIYEHIIYIISTSANVGPMATIPIEIDQMTPEDFMTWINNMKPKDDPTKGELIEKLSNGWEIQRLTSLEAIIYEGDQLNHTVGADIADVEDERIHVYSLRTANNIPLATIIIHNPVLYEIAEIETPRSMILFDSAEDKQEYYRQRELQPNEILQKIWPAKYVSNTIITIQTVPNPEVKLYKPDGIIWDRIFDVYICGRNTQSPQSNHLQAIQEWFKALIAEKQIGFTYHLG